MTSDERPVRATWHLPARSLGTTVTVYHHTHSTNDLAAAFADRPDAHGLAFLADSQTAGRGQYGRAWQAPPRSSVLLSLLLRAPAALSRPVVLTAWAATSVCEAVADLTGASPHIKWPNDVLVQGKKVCGILIEQSARGGVIASVVGLGLNVGQSADDFAAAGLPDATSLRLLGTLIDADDVAKRLLLRLDDEYDRLCAGDPSLQDRWASRLGLLGEEVVAECAGGRHRGRLLGATFESLTFDRGDRTPLTLAPEVILHVRRA